MSSEIETITKADSLSIRAQLKNKKAEVRAAKVKYQMMRAAYPSYTALRIFRTTLKNKKDRGAKVLKSDIRKYKEMVSKVTKELRSTPEWKDFSYLNLQRKNLEILSKFCTEFFKS